MTPEERLSKIEKALSVLTQQQISAPSGGATVDAQARTTITLLIKAIKDLTISL